MVCVEQIGQAPGGGGGYALRNKRLIFVCLFEHSLHLFLVALCLPSALVNSQSGLYSPHVLHSLVCFCPVVSDFRF